MAMSEISFPAHEQVLRSRHEVNGNRRVAHMRGRTPVSGPSYRPRHSAVRHSLLLHLPTGSIHS